MATTFTVGATYETVCDTLLEPRAAGLAAGLSLGIVTEAQFLTMFGTVLLDWLNRTNNVYEIFTQQVGAGVAAYLYPGAMSTVEQVFVGGVDVEHVALQDLDNWRYGWRNFYGIPEFWHQDGLPPKTIEIALTPDYTGAGYLMGVGATPPYGILGEFNGAPIGIFTGTYSVVSMAVTWTGGDDIFNTIWNNYYPPLNITLSGTAYPIDTVASTTAMTLMVDAGTQSGTWSVTVGNDSNLTVCGPKSLDSVVFTLGEVIPVIPDSFCVYLAYGILAKIFSMDGEAKDSQRANYCLARFNEGINIAAAVAGVVVR